MEINSYFNFLSADDIRIKGSRIGIETILYKYIYQEQDAKTIASEYPALSLEVVHATILYYLQNQIRIDEYLADWLEFGRAAREKQRQTPPPFVLRMRALKTRQKNLDFA